MKQIDENGKEFIRLANGKPFRGIDIQLSLGLISKEKHAYHLARGTYGCVTPAPCAFKEIMAPHNWWE